MKVKVICPKCNKEQWYTSFGDGLSKYATFKCIDCGKRSRTRSNRPR